MSVRDVEGEERRKVRARGREMERKHVIKEVRESKRKNEERVQECKRRVRRGKKEGRGKRKRDGEGSKW